MVSSYIATNKIQSDMKINELIKFLEKVEKEKGNIEVVCSSFCGTNNGFVSFNIKPPAAGLDNAVVDDLITGTGALSLSVEISDNTRKSIIEGNQDMARNGYTFYRSQYVGRGEYPRPGISPCDWHIPW